MALSAAKTSFISAAALAVSVVPLGAAQAAGEPIAPQQDSSGYSTSLSEVGIQAAEYSKRTGGIGILINFGPFNGAPSIEGAGRKLVGMFEEKGAEAQYFIRISETPGLSISYATQTTGIGPMPAREAISRVDEAIELNGVSQDANADLAYNP